MKKQYVYTAFALIFAILFVGCDLSIKDDAALKGVSSTQTAAPVTTFEVVVTDAPPPVTTFEVVVTDAPEPTTTFEVVVE